MINTKKYKFQLLREDLKFLIKHVKNNNLKHILSKAKDQNPIIAKEKFKTGRYQLKLKESDINMILDDLGNIFMTEGINDQSEPNITGRKVEDLIDLFSIF